MAAEARRREELGKQRRKEAARKEAEKESERAEMAKQRIREAAERNAQEPDSGVAGITDKEMEEFEGDMAAKAAEREENERLDRERIDLQRQEVQGLDFVAADAVSVVKEMLARQAAHRFAVPSTMPPNPIPLAGEGDSGEYSFDASDLGVIGLHNQDVNTQRPPLEREEEEEEVLEGSDDELFDSDFDDALEDMDQDTADAPDQSRRSFPGDEDREPINPDGLVRPPPPDTSETFMSSFPDVSLLRRATQAALAARASVHQPDMVGSAVDDGANSSQDK